MALAINQDLRHAASTQSRRSLLLVDDDPDIVRGAKMRLTAAGYDVTGAVNGSECVSIACRDNPDAILLDVRMPGQDGLETLSQLQSDASTRDIPVVMLSGSVADEKSALDRGAKFFLRKPFCGALLLSAIDRVTTR